MLFRKGPGPHMLRRTLLKTAGALAMAPLAMGFAAKTVFASQTEGSDKPIRGKSPYNTRLVILGSTGGMTWWPGSDRASNSQALLVGDDVNGVIYRVSYGGPTPR